MVDRITMTFVLILKVLTWRRDASSSCACQRRPHHHHHPSIRNVSITSHHPPTPRQGAFHALSNSSFCARVAPAPVNDQSVCAMGLLGAPPACSHSIRPSCRLPHTPAHISPRHAKVVYSKRTFYLHSNPARCVWAFWAARSLHGSRTHARPALNQINKTRLNRRRSSRAPPQFNHIQSAERTAAVAAFAAAATFFVCVFWPHNVL